MSVEFAKLEKAAFGERCIDACTGMAFRENEAVAISPIRSLRIDPQNLSVKDCHDIGDRKTRGDMRACAAAAHPHYMPAQPQSELFVRFHSKKSRTALIMMVTSSSLSRWFIGSSKERLKKRSVFGRCCDRPSAWKW